LSTLPEQPEAKLPTPMKPEGSAGLTKEEEYKKSQKKKK
jgi:hypothetical protein